MPSPHKRRLEQQRARRERGHEQFPWDSPGDLERRKKQTSGVHKSRVAKKIKAVIASNNDEKRADLDAATRSAFERFPSMVNHEYRKCLPTFCGLPGALAELEIHPHKEQRIMKRAREETKDMACTISHAQACIDGTVVRFSSVLGYDSHDRRAWPDYRRSPFTIACAYDRADIARALVVAFDCAPHIETGLVLVDEDGNERVWGMTGFDLTIEFGCIRTFEMLCEIGEFYPDATYAMEYAGLSQREHRTLCNRNRGNYLCVGPDDAEGAIESLEVYTGKNHDCDCSFCIRNI
jgi:hypothetical protein